MNSNQRHHSGFRLAGYVAAYAGALSAAVAVALTWDVSAEANSARVERDPVEVAALPPQVLPAAQAALAFAEGTGTFKGTIVFEGTPPAPAQIVKKGDAAVKDAAVCAADDLFSQELVVNKDNKGIANVCIYLQKAPAGAPKTKPAEDEVVFDQMGCKFIPYVLKVQTGQTVLVKSGDPVSHNTHTTPLKNPGFNQAIPINERKGVPLKYTKPERLPVKVSCDFHPWMKAWHLVQDHPYTAVTDENGNFSIENLPAGKHEFTIWVEKPGYLDRKYAVEIKAGETKEVKLSYPASKFALADSPKPQAVAAASAE